jgi:tetrapyrrole methylase family protein/MazG family protein
MKTNDSCERTENNFNRLLNIIQHLRSSKGCLWDRQQKKEDVARYLIDEAYEVIDAIDSGLPNALREEMGDLLFQIFFLARISEEAGDFSLADVMEDVTEKMIRRHPHVFGNTKVRDVEDIRSNWEDIKRHKENKIKVGILDRIPRSMPSLLAAQKMTDLASKLGFDWGKAEDVLVKIEEELLEFKTALKSHDSNKVREEIGDVFLSLVNLCRFMEVSAEESLKAAINKFGRRFRYIEDHLAARGVTPMEASLEEMDDLWNQSKRIDGE